MTVDLAAVLPVPSTGSRRSGVELSVRGENLFDAGFEQAVGFPGRGRTLLVGGRLIF